MMWRDFPVLLAVAVLGVCFSTGCSEKLSSRGRDLYLGSGCARCHGQSLEGTSLGPSLQQVRTSWTSERLADYLEDPNSFISIDPRLQNYKKQYGASMPSYGALDEMTRLEIARYLIGEEE